MTTRVSAPATSAPSVRSATAVADLFAPAGRWARDAEFEALWPDADRIEGWLAVGQARALFRAATLVPEGCWIVEIGSHKGRSTVFLARAKAAGVKMLAIDPFDNPRWGGGPEVLAEFRRTLEAFGLEGAVDTYRGVSIDAAAEWNGEPVGLLFVDGAHDRASVLADIDGWEPWIADGGLVVFHDAFSSVGTTQALTLRHLANRRFRFLGSERSLVAFAREDLSVRGAAGSGAGLAARYPYFVRNLSVKLLLRRGRSELARWALRYRDGDDLY